VFMRQARQMIAPFDVISADTLVSRIFTETAGEAAEGVAFTFPPSPTELASATSAVTAIQALDYDPGGYTLLAYAAFEVWAEGVRRAGSFDAAAVAQAIRSAPVQTALGAVSFDAKGDIVTPYPPFVWHVWKDGQRVRID